MKHILELLSNMDGWMLVGLIFFCLSFYILFTNEGRALQTAAALDEGLSAVLSIGDIQRLDPQNEGRLLHVSGVLRTSAPLSDPNYGVSVQCVKLKRQVEMFQWVETTPYVSIGHGEEFESTYSTEWRWEVVNSEDFKEKNGHQNPSAMSVESFTAVASDVHVGSYYLSKGLIEKIDNFKQLILIQNGKPHADVITQGDYFYHSASPSNPEVGDLRITFWYAGGSLGDLFHLEDTVSVVARQRGVELVPYKTKAGDQLELLYMGNHTAEEMFHAEHRSNTLKTWMLRVAGWAAIFLAIGLMMNSHTLVDWFPILQNLVSLDFFAVCLSSSLSLMIIAARWSFYRPLLSGIQAVAAVGILFLARSRVPCPIPCSSPKKFQ